MVAPEAYPALIERALRLIDQRGEPVGTDELALALFGGTAGLWTKLIGQVLGADARFRQLADGRFALRANPPPTPLTEADIRPVGLVVLATGPKPWKDPIVALGAARWRGERLESEEWFVRPDEPCRVPAYLARYGVAAGAIEEGAPLARAIEALLDFIGDAPLAGLDVTLAAARLQYALRALGRAPLSNETVELALPYVDKPDLLRLARQVRLAVPDRPRPANLAALAARLAALGAESRSEVAVVLAERYPYATSALDATAWRHLLDARLLVGIPDSPGVYLFRDACGRLLYVGKATSLRARLASYLRGNFPLIRQMPGLVEATADLEHEALPGELAARLREAELIAAERPAYNVQRRVEPVLTRARLALDDQPSEDGRRVPRLVMSTDADDDGILTTLAAASRALATARRNWWPTRPRASERPSPGEVRRRFDELARTTRDELAAVELPGAFSTEALAGGLLVVASPRPVRSASPAASPDRLDDDGVTRERYDREWPPRWLMDWDDDGIEGDDRAADLATGRHSSPLLHASTQRASHRAAPGSALPLGEGHGEGVPGVARATRLVWTPVAGVGTVSEPPAASRPPGWTAMRVDTAGLRAVAFLDAADPDDSDLPTAAIEALASAPERPPSAPEAGLAALSVLLAALRRGEAGLRVWPMAALTDRR